MFNPYERDTKDVERNSKPAMSISFKNMVTGESFKNMQGEEMEDNEEHIRGIHN